MNWIINTLREYPEIAVYLTLGLGFLIGPIKIKSFSLGNVTAVLLAGVLIGQLGIHISPNVKAVAFLLFLFAVGYGVGPQFFRGLKSDGIPQVIFAIVICVLVLLSAFIAAKFMGYNPGLAAGLLSGGATISAVLGVAGDTISKLGLPPDEAKAWINIMPVAYAVTYIFGTAGSAWILASLGPKLLGVDLVKECKEYEQQHAGLDSGDGGFMTYMKNVLRAYKCDQNSKWIGKTIAELEVALGPTRAFVETIRRNGKIIDADPHTVIQSDDVLAIVASREAILKIDSTIGTEIDDPELMNFRAEILDVVITAKQFDGATLKHLSDMGGDEGHGVFLRKLIRGGVEIPFSPQTKIDRGDVLELMGARRDVERVAKKIGYADRPTEKTDVTIIGFGIVIGALFGAMSIKIGSIPISLSTSGGALIAGLVAGYLRAVYPTFGRVPKEALWAFNNMGLCTFIAVIGITSGPGFVQGLKQSGISLFLCGIFVTSMPFIIGIFIGKYVFKMHPGILLGACAGARTTTAALGAIQEAAQSKVPALGYTITYAVGNTLLILWGVVIVVLMR